jgi:hypothetical protein
VAIMAAGVRAVRDVAAPRGRGFIGHWQRVNVGAQGYGFRVCICAMLRAARDVGNGASSTCESRFKCNAKTREFRANQRGGIHFLKGGLWILMKFAAQVGEVVARFENQCAYVFARKHAPSLTNSFKYAVKY